MSTTASSTITMFSSLLPNPTIIPLPTIPSLPSNKIQTHSQEQQQQKDSYFIYYYYYHYYYNNFIQNHLNSNRSDINDGDIEDIIEHNQFQDDNGDTNYMDDNNVDDSSIIIPESPQQQNMLQSVKDNDNDREQYYYYHYYSTSKKLKLLSSPLSQQQQWATTFIPEYSQNIFEDINEDYNQSDYDPLFIIEDEQFEQQQIIDVNHSSSSLSPSTFTTSIH